MNSDEDQDPSKAPPEGEPVELPPSETSEAPAQGVSQKHRPTPDEALAEMRRSLREDEPVQETGFLARFTRFTQRLFHRKPQPTEIEASEETPTSRLEIPEPLPMPRLRARQTEAPKPTVDEQASTPDNPADETSKTSGMVPTVPTPEADFGSFVRTRFTEVFQSDEELPPPSAPQSILTSIREEGEVSEEEAANLRQEALEDYVLTPEEPEDERGPAYVRTLRRSWRYMRPLEKRLMIGSLVIVGLAVIFGSGFLLVKPPSSSVPTATPTLSTLPFPISISLPGGWVFPLRTGFVENGKWNPTGAEWLHGTEITRWVSLPWTVQLEAVIRTLKSNDEIRLSMSNYDNLVYKVKSIEEVPSSQIGDLAPSTPSLLLILSKSDSDSRWVVTAQP